MSSGEEDATVPIHKSCRQRNATTSAEAQQNVSEDRMGDKWRRKNMPPTDDNNENLVAPLGEDENMLGTIQKSHKKKQAPTATSRSTNPLRDPAGSKGKQMQRQPIDNTEEPQTVSSDNDDGIPLAT